ncbi:MAG: type II secretion system F family protein [Phycisphaerae bacterium]|nr:type II secretion system F family protein [Phycisphaerae bacterium]
MKLTYQGYNAAGKAVRGEIDAASIADGQEALRRQSIFPTTIEEAKETPGGAAARSVSLRELAGFCRQLSILVSTHTPLVQALTVTERQSPPGAWRSTIADVRRRVEEGASLAEALAAHPSCFDAICRSMIAAGESGGMLDAMLRDLSALLRRQLTLRKGVIGAMSYPLILIGVSVAVVTTMLTFVLPQFQVLFETLGASLPPTTQFLMLVGNGLRSYWYIVIPALLVAGGGAWRSLRSSAVRARLDRIVLGVPKLGGIVRGFITARIARLLGVLLLSKITLLEALRLTREATSNSCYADLLASAEEAVTRGQTLSSVLADGDLIAPSVCEALSSGERSGQVGEVLVQVADYLDEDNDQIVKTLAGIIEPLVLTVLGLVVGFVAISMFLPLFDLTAAGGSPAGGPPA